MLIIDREFIERCCSEYDRRNQGKYAQIEETAILNWISKQREPKFLNKEYFLRVGRWKTPRYAATRKTNNAHNIIEITRSAYLAKDDLLKLKTLKRLNGVGNAVAGTILYYLLPEKFGIFDYHVRNTLKEAGKLTKGEEDDSARVWLKCTQEIRKLSSLHNKTLREVEKALFAYDKWGKLEKGENKMGSKGKRPHSNLPRSLFNILSSLSVDTKKQISPHGCILGPTKKGTKYHYIIPNGKPRVIAWASIKTKGRRADIVMKPCVTVGITGGLLNKGDPTICKLRWNPNANFVSMRKGGSGIWQGVIYAINDKGYQLVLYALIMAAKECLRRAGLRRAGH